MPTTYADPTRCPDCQSPIPQPPTTCPTCGLTLTGPDAITLFRTLQSADALLARLRPGAPATVTTSTIPTTTPTPAPIWVPSPHAPQASRLSGASVPKILLSLGALCLLVAAITFLAVAWSWLGVSGRTAVLVGLTVVAGGLAAWFARTGLRTAAEAFATVASGFLALDVIGADNAGWLGDLSDWGLLALTGGTLAVAGFAASLVPAMRTNAAARALVVPQLVGPGGAWLVPVGLVGATSLDSSIYAAAVLAFGVLALAAHRCSRLLLALLCVAGAATWWVALLGSGIVRMAEDATVRGLWLNLGAWPALAAALVLVPLAWLLSRRQPLAAAIAGVAGTILTGVLAFPSFDNTATQAATVMLCLSAAWATSTYVVARRWTPAPLMSAAAALIGPAIVALFTLARVIESASELPGPWESRASVKLQEPQLEAHPAVLVGFSAVAALFALTFFAHGASHQRDRLTAAKLAAPYIAATLALGLAATLAAYAIPLAVPVGVLLITAAALAAWGVRRRGPLGDTTLAAGAAIAVIALLGASPSVTLSLIVLIVIAATAAQLALTGQPGLMTAGQLVLPAALGGIVWAIGELIGLDQSWRAIPILLVAGGLALWRPAVPLETSAALTGAIASLVAVGDAFGSTESTGMTSLAIHLTVAGALVTASAVLHPTRRLLAYPGGLLLAAATWVRLHDIGVTAPEAYTMPTALVLLALGVYRLRSNPGLSSQRALTAGLTLATVPSLLRVLVEDPISLRALLLGLGCLALILLGTRLRWSSPLVVGAAVGAVLVLAELGPYAAALPPWTIIAGAGALLTVVGVTWESRLNNVREAGRYLAHLR